MELNSFCLDNYDCIGFDLDCTLAEYNLKELMKLIYDLMAKFMVENKNYDRQFLMEPYSQGEYLIQKGIFIDFQKGNLLKVAENGFIIKATHGTTNLDEDAVIEQYGTEKKFELGMEFLNNPLLSLNALRTKMVYRILDCFDMPCALLYARIVDQIDNKNGPKPEHYNVFQDILEGLWSLYSHNFFATGESDFFSALQENPSRFYKKWDVEKISWLKKLKEKKFVFLLTGSYIDFASLTANTCIGADWKDCFDIILYDARKPYFFTENRPFYLIVNEEKGELVRAKEIKTKSVYCQGSWKELKALLQKETKLSEPKCVYFGDNLIQDVFAPVHVTCCDTVAVLVELKEQFENSQFWGSFFVAENGLTPHWNRLIKSNAKICISGLDVLSKQPLSFQYKTLTNDGNDSKESNGYYAV